YLPELEKIYHSIHLINLPKWKSMLNVAVGLLGNRPLQVNYFKSSTFQGQLDQIIKNNTFDAIHVQHLRMSQFAMNIKGTFKILDMPDAFSLYWQRRKSVKRSFVNAFIDNIESRRVLHYEKEIL